MQLLHQVICRVVAREFHLKASELDGPLTLVVGETKQVVGNVAPAGMTPRLSILIPGMRPHSPQLYNDDADVQICFRDFAEMDSMQTLSLKLVLTPTLIGVASLAGRKWGAAVSGWLVGLPLTSGPIVLFLALEEGESFASRAALGVLLGLISVAVFSLTYGWVGFRLGWPLATLTGWLAFLVATFLLQQISLSLLPAFVGVVTVLMGTLWLMPAKYVPMAKSALPPWDIPARMLIATTFVLLLTGVADVLGASLSGLLAPFPIFASILAVFTHRFQGATAALHLLRGVILGSFSFAVFFLVVALMIESAGIALTFLCATLAALALHGTSVLLLRRWRTFGGPHRPA